MKGRKNVKNQVKYKLYKFRDLIGSLVRRITNDQC